MLEQDKPAKPSKPAKTSAPKRKAATRKTAAGRAAARRAPPTRHSRVTQAGRRAFLAGLGVCGTAFDRAQNQFKRLERRLEIRRKKADKLYAQLVKRGAKVEQQARGAIDLPGLNRAALEARLEPARARFKAFKETLGIKAAA